MRFQVALPVRWLTSAGLACGLLACNSASTESLNDTNGGPTPPAAFPIEIQPGQVLSAGMSSTASASLARELDSEAALDSFWVYLGTGAPRPPAAFADSVVLAVTLGPRPTSGYGIHIDSLTLLRDTIQVHVTATERLVNCPLLQVITSPFQLVQVPRLAGPMVFVTTTAATGCS